MSCVSSFIFSHNVVLLQQSRYYLLTHAKLKEIPHVLPSEVNEQDHQTKSPQ